MLAALVQLVILAAPACATPDVAGSTLRSGYLPASDDATFARCSADPEYLFQNRGSEVTNSFLLELSAPLRDRANFERAVFQLAVAVNGLWIGNSPRQGEFAPVGPCADDLLRFLDVGPARGELQRTGASAAGGLAVLALLRVLGLEDEAVWAKRDARSPRVDALIARTLAGGAIEGSKVGPGDDQAVEMLRVGNVVEVRTPAGTDWIFVASRPRAAVDGSGKRWRFMGVHVAAVERAGGRGVPGALVIRTGRMRAWFDATRRWWFEPASACGSGPEGTLGRYYDTWEVLREEEYPLPPLLPVGSLLPDLPMSGDWSPWPDLFQEHSPSQRTVRPAGTRR